MSFRISDNNKFTMCDCANSCGGSYSINEDNDEITPKSNGWTERGKIFK